MARPAFVKIPSKFPATSKKAVKVCAVYYALKQFFYNGLLYDFIRNRKHYASELGISVSKLRYMQSALVSNGLAQWNGKHLQLLNYKDANALLGIQCKRFIKFQSTDVHAIESFLYAVAIKQNFKEQKFKIEQKIVAFEFQNVKASMQMGFDYDVLIKKTSQRTSVNALKKLSKRILKANKGAIIRRYENAAREIQGATMEPPQVNPVVTLSCSGIARVCLNSANKSTGYYLCKRLAFYGYLTTQADNVPITPGLKTESRFYQAAGIGHKTRTLANRVNIGF